MLLRISKNDPLPLPLFKPLTDIIKANTLRFFYERSIISFKTSFKANSFNITNI